MRTHLGESALRKLWVKTNDLPEPDKTKARDLLREEMNSLNIFIEEDLTESQNSFFYGDG
jgi:hypothetical protein